MQCFMHILYRCMFTLTTPGNTFVTCTRTCTLHIHMYIYMYTTYIVQEYTCTCETFFHKLAHWSSTCVFLLLQFFPFYMYVYIYMYILYFFLCSVVLCACESMYMYMYTVHVLVFFHCRHHRHIIATCYTCIFTFVVTLQVL